VRRYDKGQYNRRVELTNEVIFRKVTNGIRESKLYLMPDLTIDDVAEHLGTNRTYISRAFKAHGEGFSSFLMKTRVEKLQGYIQNAEEEGRVLEDGEDLAMVSGFLNKRAMQRAVRKIEGKTFGQVWKECSESGNNSLPLSRL